MKIQILGASTSAKKSHAGNVGHAPATLLLTMEGGIARLTVDLDDQEGHASFRLKKDEAIALIEGLKEIYNLNEENLSVRERLVTPYPVDIAGAMLGKNL